MQHTIKDNQMLASSLKQKTMALSRQVGLGRAMLLMAHECIRRLLAPYCFDSYAQFGEDRLIDLFLSNTPSGVFVDVGCNHPIRYSNTWKLYLRGWRGLVIDPNPDCIALFRKIRPNDIALQCVVSNIASPVDFYFSNDSDLISGVGEKRAGHWQRTVENSTVISCQPATLTRLLEEHDIPKEFDLLSVDVEGHELPVLESLDFSKYSPQLIVCELHDFELSAPTQNTVYKMLTEMGYSLSANMGPSVFFRRKRKNG